MPLAKADRGAPLGPGGQSGRDGDQQHQVALDAEHPQLRGDADLDGEGDDEQEGHPGRHHQGPDGGHSSPSHRRTVTKRSLRGVDERLDDEVEGQPAAGLLGAPHGADRDRRREGAAVRAARGQRAARLEHGVAVEARVHDQGVALARAPGRARAPRRAASRTPTAKSGSVSSWMVDRDVVAWATRPTSPAPLTTGMPSWIPSSVPLSISMVWEKFDTGPATTRAVRRGMSPVHGMPTSAEERRRAPRRRPPPRPRGPRAPRCGPAGGRSPSSGRRSP